MKNVIARLFSTLPYSSVGTGDGRIYLALTVLGVTVAVIVLMLLLSGKKNKK